MAEFVSRSPEPCSPDRTAAAAGARPRRRNLPSNWPTPGRVCSPSRSRKKAKFVAKLSLSRYRNRLVSKLSGSRTSSSVSSTAPAGSIWAIRATILSASNAATRTVRAPLPPISVSARAVRPPCLPTAADVMHEQVFEACRIHRDKRIGDTVRIVQGDRAIEAGIKPSDRLGRQRMCQSLLDDVTAGLGVKGLNAQHSNP